METNFVDGLRASAPKPGAPSYIKASLWVSDVDAFCKWVQEHATAAGSVNIDIKESKTGKWYAQWNNWQKKIDAEPAEYPRPSDEDIANSIPW